MHQDRHICCSIVSNCVLVLCSLLSVKFSQAVNATAAVRSWFSGLAKNQITRPCASEPKQVTGCACGAVRKVFPMNAIILPSCGWYSSDSRNRFCVDKHFILHFILLRFILHFTLPSELLSSFDKRALYLTLYLTLYYYFLLFLIPISLLSSALAYTSFRKSYFLKLNLLLKRLIARSKS